ncbi:hypothetical protein IT575_13880 [bacterium]|nr:hypothetical protein [bacterium]
MSDKRLSLEEYLDHPDWPENIGTEQRLALRSYWCFAVRQGSAPPRSSCWPGCAGAVSAITLSFILVTGIPQLSRIPSVPLHPVQFLLAGLALAYLAYLVLRVFVYRIWARINLRRILDLHRKVAALPWTVQCLIHLDMPPPVRLSEYELELIGTWYSDNNIEMLLDTFDEVDRNLNERLKANDSLFDQPEFLKHCLDWGLEPSKLRQDCQDFPLEHLLHSVLQTDSWPSTLSAAEWDEYLSKLRL